MQTWHRVASIDFHCPPSCRPVPYFQSRFLSVHLWAGEQRDRVPDGSFQVEWRARKRCGRGRLPFLVLGAHLGLMDTRGHPQGLV